MFFYRLKKERVSPPAVIEGIRVRSSTRARRMALRVDARRGDVVLTLPTRFSVQKAALFIQQHQDWIRKQRAGVMLSPSIYSGMMMSVLGVDYQVIQRTGRGVSRIEGKTIVVYGAPEHFHRRLKDFLKKHAEYILTELTKLKLKELGLPMKSISIRDPKSRWGSCAPDGRLMFSWRLILAPADVCDYVVAHEVAHRVHMNHSQKFWALCVSLTNSATESRRWLRLNGAQLMRSI